jgi:hypothetical protein
MIVGGFLSVSLVRRAHCGILSQSQLRYKSLAAVTKPPRGARFNLPAMEQSV